MEEMTGQLDSQKSKMYMKAHYGNFKVCGYQEQSGAVEACWAHNPEVRGSKPRSANIFKFIFLYEHTH